MSSENVGMVRTKTTNPDVRVRSGVESTVMLSTMSGDDEELLAVHNRLTR
jgi:hypothetical protein